jgi:DNA replication and repair protein RecF
MGFILQRLSLNDFRNHRRLVLDGVSGAVVIVGANAAGKSSIIEAIQLLSMLESFRSSIWVEMVHEGSGHANIDAQFVDGERRFDVAMSVVDGKREYLFNGKKRRPGDVLGIVSAVLFTPADLSLVKGTSEQRRLFIDSLGRRLAKPYAKAVLDYQKTLRQRNHLLKEYQKNRLFSACPDQAEAAWDMQLAEHGALLTVLRQRLQQRLYKVAARHYRAISGGEALGMAYLPSCRTAATVAAGSPENPLSGNMVAIPTDESPPPLLDLAEVKEQICTAIAQRRMEELARGVSLVGPHKDDILFSVDGREARGFASQGQQRSIALAMKLAEVDILREATGNEPILLLDDVLSELDEHRRQHLFKQIEQVSQAFITTTDIRVIQADFLSQATVVNLRPVEGSSGPALRG